jgi:serine/threonine protein kinase
VAEPLAKNPVAIGRFLREARAVSALNHPNVCTIYEVDEFEGAYFIALEFLDGESLEQYIPHQHLEIAEILDIAMQIADGLAAAHAKGVIHRDIKPSNIFVTTGDVVKILDFGLSKLTTASEESPTASDDRTASTEVLSRAFGIVGTVAYMSPEQARGEVLDHRTDLFSLGAVIYEMASGHKAFSGKSPALTLAAVLNSRPQSIRTRDPRFPAELEKLIDKALQKNRALRYQTALELAADLRRLKDDLNRGKGTALPSRNEKSSGEFAATPRGRKSRQINSLAVLPFGNETSEPDGEYLSEGITDSIINAISQFPKISVMARSTVFRRRTGGRRERPPLVGQPIQHQIFRNICSPGRDLQSHLFGVALAPFAARKS